MTKRTTKFALGAIFAAVGGYIAGILTAPKSGKETRKDIHDAAVKAKKEAETQLKSLYIELSKLIDDGKERAKKMQSKAKKEVHDAIEKAQSAKQKTAEVISSIRDGAADDAELQAAIKDANKAIEHLRSYVEKAKKS
jgi:gas vesicle protein